MIVSNEVCMACIVEIPSTNALIQLKLDLIIGFRKLGQFHREKEFSSLHFVL